MIPQELLQDLKPRRRETLEWIERHGGTFINKNGQHWSFKFDAGGGADHTITFYQRHLSIPHSLALLVAILNWPGHRDQLEVLHTLALATEKPKES